jgi:hypothetical protein
MAIIMFILCLMIGLGCLVIVSDLRDDNGSKAVGLGNALVLALTFTIFSISHWLIFRDDFRNEAVRYGAAEWVPGLNGDAKFQWKHQAELDKKWAESEEKRHEKEKSVNE